MFPCNSHSLSVIYVSTLIVDSRLDGQLQTSKHLAQKFAIEFNQLS